MLLWLTGLFVRTPPQAPPEGQWAVHTDRVEQMTPRGVYCAWEAESLLYAGTPIWGDTPPEDESFCKAPSESSRTVDILGQNGPYLSVRLWEWSCCPDREQTVSCRTYDLRTGTPVTLEAYDPKSYAWRAKKITRVLARKGGGFTVAPTSFRVDGKHVQLCVTRGAEKFEISIR